MTRNMGILDRSLRSIAALAVVALWYTGRISGTLAIVLLVIAGIWLLTSLISFCPLYSLLGFSTGKKPAA
jgi:hypothetical protein